MRVVAIVVCWTATGCDKLFGLGPLDPPELLLVFKSNRNTSSLRAWQATRSGRGETFSSPVLVPGMENTTVFGLDISPLLRRRRESVIGDTHLADRRIFIARDAVA
jgi:hypothetical protein